MRALLHAHSEAITQTLRQFWLRPVTAFLSAGVIGVGLLFPVGGYIALANLKILAAGADTDARITVFLAPDAGARDRDEIERRLRLAPEVKNYRFVGKDAALKELQNRSGIGDLMTGLSGNPLPDTYLLTPRGADPAGESRLVDSLRNWPKVAEVDSDAMWSDRLRLLANTGDLLVLGLGVVLGLAMLAITFNTIRLQVLTRAEEIVVLRLFGATPSYVRRPFLYFGALQGLVAALFAWFVSGVGILWIKPKLAALVGAYGLSGQLAGLTPTDGLALLGFAAVVGLLGAWLAFGEH